LAVDRKETSVSDSYLGATEEELLGAPLARHLNNASFGLFGGLGKPLVLDLHDDEPACLLTGSRWYYRHQPGSPADAGATHVVLRAGVRIMRRKLTAALILAALIVVCVSGCHFVTVHTSPARHGSAARR
jgi:hypothetical protein